MELTDEELVLQARAGDRRAFDVLAERYWHRCCRIAWVYLHNHADAEDQAQNALLRAFLHLDSCDETRFRSWLDTIVQNECRMAYRNRRRRPWPLIHLPISPRVATREPGPERQVADEEMAHLVRREVAQLPWLVRDTMRLYRLEELDISRVAEIVGIKIYAAKSRLARGHLELRDRVARKLRSHQTG